MKDKIEYCKSTKTDYVKLAKFLEEQDWNNVLSCNNVELATNIFVNTFSDNIEKSKVIKTIKIKHYNRLKPWITNSIIVSIKHRDKMKKKKTIETLYCRS